MSQRAATPDLFTPGANREMTVVPNDQLFSELQAAVAPDAVLRTDERLAGRTTLRVGGSADFYAEPASEADLTRLLQACERNALPCFVLGRGSNLLIKDGGIRGLVICLAHPHFSRVEVTGFHLHCGAGAKLKQVSVLAKQSQLTGLEFLEGIPGTVGGALRMNAGAMGGWMFDVVESVRFMDYGGQTHEEPAAQVKVEYRSCLLFKENIALGAVLKGHPASREVVEKRMKTFSQKRWESQPAAPSAGCIFKNPGAIPAGKLIDELGLKGARIGGAAVSTEHGNFIINEGTATARDVLELIEIIRQKARTERGIELETEVEIVGEA